MSKNSGNGCIIYEEKLPIAHETVETCKEFKLEASTIALSGGEDYELLFTIDSKDLKKIEQNKELTVIGYITKESNTNLITRDGKTTPITSMGWKSF